MKTNNKSVALNVTQERQLRKIAKTHRCIASRGRNPGPSISMLLHEIADGRLVVVPSLDLHGAGAPAWWPRDGDGALEWWAHRRRITIEQEIWCARHLDETNDGLGFLAAGEWFESGGDSRPGWWPEGESMSRARLEKHLGDGVDLDEWANDHGVEWNDAGWAEWKSETD